MRGVVRSPDGIQIVYDVMGKSFPALVMVHGWSCDRTYWADVTGPLSARYTVVCLDLGGHGESSSGRQEWTMRAFGEDVVAVVDDLKLEDVVLVGHSMGGDVIVESALLLGSRARGLVWVDTYRQLGSPRGRDEVHGIIEPLQQDFARGVEDLVRHRLFTTSADPLLVSRVASDMAAATPSAAVDALRHSITNDGPILAHLRELDVPLVAINPDNAPTDEPSLLRYGVETVLISGVGHFPMLEAPTLFVSTISRVLDEISAR